MNNRARSAKAQRRPPLRNCNASLLTEAHIKSASDLLALAAAPAYEAPGKSLGGPGRPCIDSGPIDSASGRANRPAFGRARGWSGGD